ncbi:MAG: DUF2461 domain-containing protein [Bacteroidota bacterium]
MIQKETFDFLLQLKENNHRDWFQKHKEDYQSVHQNMIDFAAEVYHHLQLHDQVVDTTGKKALHRIYRDVRFSKDKSPYKKNFSGSFKRATAALRGGYYFHIEPGNTFLAGGFWGPNSADLKLIRSHIDAEPERLREIIEDKGFVHQFDRLKGEQVKTAPKGYHRDHPAIDLLRYKQFLLIQNFTDEQAQKENFALRVATGFQHMRPFLDYMSEVLTTDLNGISLL